MTAAERDRVLAGVPGHADPPPVVLMTVFTPSAPMLEPPPRDPYGEDVHLGFYPAG